MFLQPDSSYLSSINDNGTRAVLAIETVQGRCDVGCESTARKMGVMKLETYWMRRGTMVLQRERWEDGWTE